MTSGFALFDTRRSQDSYSSDTNSPISFRKNSLTNFKTSLMIFNGKKKESRGWSPTDSSNTHQDDSTLFSKSNTIPISWIDKSQPSPSSKSLSASLGSTSPLFLPRYHTEFESICKIGKGGFGDVFKVRNALDGCLYAIKRIKLGNDKAKNARFLREVSALSRLSHVNIVRYYQAWIEAGSDNESDDDEFDESDEEDDHHRRLDHREDESYDRFANSEDEDNSYINAPFDIDIGTAQNSPKEDLLSCDICKKVYKDWEVPTQDWFLLDARTQNFNLCRDCYNEEIRKSGIRSSPGTISSMPMTQYLYIQMEYCDRTLRAGLDDKSIWQSKDEKFIWSLFRQIVEATKYIHLNNCIHRDLKPSNIFLTSEGNVKLGDFGLATGEVIVKEASASMKRRAPNSHPLKTNSFLLLPKTSPKGKERTTDIGTMLYRAPELEESEEYDEKVDVFSLGIILFELWHPFYTGMERVEVLETLRHKHQLPSGFTSMHPVQSELILNLTQRNPAMRHSASSLLEAIPVSQEKQEMTKIISENQELKSQVSELQNLLKELQLQVKSLTDERDQQKEEIFKLRTLTSNSMDVKPV